MSWFYKKISIISSFTCNVSFCLYFIFPYICLLISMREHIPFLIFELRLYYIIFDTLGPFFMKFSFFLTTEWYSFFSLLSFEFNLVPSTHRWWLMTIYNSSLQESDTIFWVLCSHVHTHTRVHTPPHTHFDNKSLKSELE